MGRKPCCMKEGLKRGAWSAQEDRILVQYIKAHGEGKWRDLPSRAGLKRCGKSCRLRWLNYLNPSIKRGNISPDEEDLIIKLHKLLGNRWSLIAGRLPGRTDNEIKNYWNTCLSKKIKALSNSEKYDHEATASTDPRRHQAIRTKAVRCNKVYAHDLGHGEDIADQQAKQRPAPPAASSASSAVASSVLLLQETDLSDYFVDLSDRELLLPAAGVHEDLFGQAWHSDVQECCASDKYEVNGAGDDHMLPDQLEEAVMEEWVRTFANLRPSL